jgi:UDP-N-acetylglucosamine:LPS N-acetylglucosamine transferase
MRDALLLSGSIGMGHDVLADACQRSLARRGWSTNSLDAMGLLGRRKGSVGETVFRSMLAMPGVYDAFHFGALRTGNRLAQLTNTAACRNIVPRLRRQLDSRPADLVISVFSTAAAAVSRLHSRYPGMLHVVFCTDAVPHRLWVHPHTDLYLVTSKVAESAVLRFAPQAEVAVVPAPVRPAFYHPPSQPEARERLGVPPGERCVLLMSGAWGLGPLAETATALAAHGLHVLAVAGRNPKLEAKLREAELTLPRLHAIGYTEHVPELMAAADLVITSSGDTCTEARVVGRHLLLLDVVQGQGRDNLQHELELGDASVTSAGPADVVRNTLAALDRIKPPSPGAGARYSEADWEASFTAALDRISRG